MPAAIRVSTLKSHVSLEEEREALTRRIAEIDERLRVLGGRFPRTLRRVNPNRRGHGEMTRDILFALKEAGGNGVRICEVARKIDHTNTRSLNAWFSAYLKTMPGLVRLSRGRYALRAFPVAPQREHSLNKAAREAAANARQREERDFVP